LLTAINFVFISLTEIFRGAFARLVKVFLTSCSMVNVTEPETPAEGDSYNKSSDVDH
jgi:hypothetical protein